MGKIPLDIDAYIVFINQSTQRSTFDFRDVDTSKSIIPSWLKDGVAWSSGYQYKFYISVPGYYLFRQTIPDNLTVNHIYGRCFDGTVINFDNHTGYNLNQYFSFVQFGVIGLNSGFYICGGSPTNPTSIIPPRYIDIIKI